MKERIQKTKLEKYAEKIKLRVLERRELRERILSYMEYHPIVEPQIKKKTTKDFIESQSFITVSFKGMRLRALTGALAVLIIVGVPLAAERSVPGDVLYPVKVRFTEEVREQLTFSGYEKIAWETERVERRIAEARLLAREGKLTEEAEAAIGEDVRQHARAAQEELAELKREDANDAAVAEVVLQSALGVQSLVLDEQIAEEKKISSTTRASIEGLASALHEVISDVNEASQRASTTPSYASFVGRVEFETTRARELFESIDGAASEEEKTEILRRLEDNERAFKKAQQRHDDGDDVVAIEALRTVLSNTQKLISFMTDIDVRSSVEIETLVPKTLTEEERLVLINDMLAYVRTVENAVGENIVEIDEALREKATSGLAELTDMRMGIEEVLQGEAEVEEKLDVAEAQLVSAVALAYDLEQLLTQEEEVVIEDETSTSTETEIEGEFGILDPVEATSTATSTEGDAPTSTTGIGTSTETESE